MFILKNIWYLTKTYAYPTVHKLYARVPTKGRWILGIVSIVVLVVIGGLLISYMNSPKHANIATDVTNPAKSEYERLEHDEVQKLLHGSWEEQKIAATEVLRNSGLTVLEGEVEPASDSLFIIPPELTRLTYDANLKSTGGNLTLEELSKMLNDFEFPFIEGEDPAILLKTGIQKWVRAALDDPEQDGTYVPLFLDAMANEQVPAIDLTSDDWQPPDYRMTYLEFQVFLNYLFQAIPQEEQASGLWNWFSPVAHAAAPEGTCSYAMDWLVNQGKNAGHGTIATIGAGLIGLLTTELTGLGISQFGDVASKAATALGAAFKIAKIGMLYWGVEIKLEALPENVHKSTSKETAKEIEYTAKVGVNEEKYEEFVQQWNATPVVRNIKDCLSFAGIPMPTDTKDIAADVDKWFVEWDLIEGTGHATIGLKKNDFAYAGQLQMQVKRTGASKGEAKLVVDVEYEDTKNHKGTVTTVPVTSRAILEMNSPPSVLTAFSAGKVGVEAAKTGVFELLGLADSLVDMLAGWAQEMADPVSYYTVPVAYHEPKDPKYSYDGWVRIEQTRYRSESSTRNKETTSKSFEGKWQVISDIIRPDSHSNMIGDGSIQGAYSFYRWSDISGPDCSAFSEVSVTANDEKSSPFNGSLTKKGNEQTGYSYTLINFVEQYFIESIHDQYSDICGKIQTSNETIEKGMNFFVAPNDLLILTSEAYPKVLQGRRRIVEDGGYISIWTWRLNRVEHDSELIIREEFVHNTK